MTPELNCRRISIPLLGLDGWYARDGVAISVVSSSTQRVSTIEHADALTVQEIADDVWHHQRQKESAPQERVDLESLSKSVSHILSICKEAIASLGAGDGRSSSSCVIFTSPDSENSEVDIEVAPLPATERGSALMSVGPAPITVVVGGVRVIDRDPRNTSSRHSRRPMLSIAITFDCPVCSVAACRNLSERVQTLVQFPEMCD